MQNLLYIMDICNYLFNKKSFRYLAKLSHFTHNNGLHYDMNIVYFDHTHRPCTLCLTPVDHLPNQTPSTSCLFFTSQCFIRVTNGYLQEHGQLTSGCHLRKCLPSFSDQQVPTDAQGWINLKGPFFLAIMANIASGWGRACWPAQPWAGFTKLL